MHICAKRKGKGDKGLRLCCLCHFQQYFSYIVTVTTMRSRPRWLPINIWHNNDWKKYDIEMLTFNDYLEKLSTFLIDNFNQEF
jgi:hypothetical protein